MIGWAESISTRLPTEYGFSGMELSSPILVCSDEQIFSWEQQFADFRLKELVCHKPPARDVF